MPYARLLLIGLAAAIWGPGPQSSNFLLIDQTEIDAIKTKAAKYPWAREGLDRVVHGAERALRKPVELPNRGGQWFHWYSCKKDGAGLVTVSPTQHRCPVCGTIYTGEPYDSVAIASVHNSYASNVRELGLAYRFTGRAEFAKKAGEILLAYADKYRSYPLHNIHGEAKVGGGRIQPQTLDESMWLIPVVFGYSMVKDALSPADRRHIEDDLLLPAAEVIRMHKMGIHNIQNWKNSAVGLVGFVTGRQDLVREAIDDPDRGFRVQIAKGVTEGGLWFEGSLGYHHFMMQASWPLAEAARLAGIDLYSDRYRTLWDAPLVLALPDGNAPGFNDNGGGNVLGMAPLYEIAYARWHNPVYGHVVAGSKRNSLESLLYGTDTVPSGPTIPEESVLLKAAGFAMLRAKGTSVAMRYGTHGGGHGHPDKLNIVTFGAGQLLGLDPGSIHYGVPLHREWYRTTLAHNTVTVDQQSQAATDGALETWGDNAITAVAEKVYNGVTLRRSVAVREGRIEDRFTCSSARAHTYDWAFHCRGRFTSSLNLVPRDEALGENEGYQHVHKATSARSDAEWWARWEQDGAVLTLRVKGAPDTQVFAGEGYGRNAADRVPMVVVRRHAKDTVFEVTHEISQRK
jgi:hypothetical protein